MPFKASCPTTMSTAIRYGFLLFLTVSARGPIPDSSLLLHHHLSLFMKFVQLTIDGAEFRTEVPPGGIVWH